MDQIAKKTDLNSENIARLIAMQETGEKETDRLRNNYEDMIKTMADNNLNMTKTMSENHLAMTEAISESHDKGKAYTDEKVKGIGTFSKWAIGVAISALFGTLGLLAKLFI